tara:strand:- start:246 stop:380 length:135 start_codon:yes stop_codon:yes gene_type:complete
MAAPITLYLAPHRPQIDFLVSFFIVIVDAVEEPADVCKSVWHND